MVCVRMPCTPISSAAIARFCEAILDYLADEERVSTGHVQANQFEGQIFSAYDQLFNVWLLSKESKVRM